jgi:hypothetical protein
VKEVRYHCANRPRFLSVAQALGRIKAIFIGEFSSQPQYWVGTELGCIGLHFVAILAIVLQGISFATVTAI